MISGFGLPKANRPSVADGLDSYDPHAVVKELLHRDTYDGEWPFTVEQVELYRDGDMVFVVHDEKKYALNGNARHAGMPNFTPIWRTHQSGYGKVDIGPMIMRGLRL